MSDLNTQVDLDELHQAIVDEISAGFAAVFKTVRDHEEMRDKIATPACMIDLSSLEAFGTDPGTEQISLTAQYAAYIIVHFKETRAKRKVRKIAADLAHFIRLRRWKKTGGSTLPTSAAEVIGCFPDDFHPELDEYEVWRVEWSHVVHIGSSVWAASGETPSEVFVSMQGGGNDPLDLGDAP